MKQVKSKITGHVGELDFDSREGIFIVICYDLNTKVTEKSYYKNLEDLCEEWEDYEEPKEHWCITMYGGIVRINDNEEPIDDLIEIGNYFNSKEDAYDAWEKLKAWKRLKDKGFRLSAAVLDSFFCLDIYMSGEAYEAIKDDLKIVFGGEE